MDTTATKIFETIAERIQGQGITIIAKDEQRPWGGFLVLDENDAEKFIELYFPGYNKNQVAQGNKLSPKVLMVAPGKRLSWQYHLRRAELWSVIDGPIGVGSSDTNEQKHINVYQPGAVINLPNGSRHRLIGLDNWGIVAEIWVHTDATHPSDEDDIIRLQDDFGRN